MASFVAVYHGESMRDAKMIAVSGDCSLVAHVSTQMLDDPLCINLDTDDPVLLALNEGKRSALRLVRGETSHAEAAA